MSNFKIIAFDKNARAGLLKTPHGDIETPVFMPVGTQGTVKALKPEDLKKVGVQIILGNTYHLYLRPGNKVIKKMGGLHKFMGWEGPILTDSGGFQAFSLGAMIEHGVRKIQSSTVRGPVRQYPRPMSSLLSVAAGTRRGTPMPATPHSESLRLGSPAAGLVSKFTEEGIHFQSHLDGTKHLLTPEKSIEVQLDLCSDIVLVLDELLSPKHDPKYVKNSLERTHRWEIRSKNYFKENVKKSQNPKALLFGIVQGVYDQKIREEEAKWAYEQDFDGISIGGSCGVSEYWPRMEEERGTNWAETKAIYETMGWVTPHLPEEWARHALGIGEVVDFFECVQRGIDMFDCVAPTRRARNGSLYISFKNGGKPGNKFTINISKSGFKEDKKAIDPGCLCYTCQNFSRSYLRHLYLAQEILYHELASIHNVYFMVNLVKQIRQSILDKQFSKLKKQWLG